MCGPVTGCPRNTRRRQRTAGRKKKFCSPSAPSRFTLARPRVRRAASRFIGQLVAVNRQRSSQRPLLGAPTANRCHRTTHAQLDEPKTDDETSSCCVLNQQLLRVKREMARRPSILFQYKTDSHSPPRSANSNTRSLRWARKKQGRPPRQANATAASSTCGARTATAVERAAVHVHSHVRSCRWVISPHTTHARAQERFM